MTKTQDVVAWFDPYSPLQILAHNLTPTAQGLTAPASAARGLLRVGCWVGPAVTRPGPPQTWTCPLKASGASGTRASAPLERSPWLPPQTPAAAVPDPGGGERRDAAQRGERLPAARALLAAATKPRVPRLGRRLVERVQLPVVAPDAGVLVGPPTRPRPLPVRLAAWVVPLRAAPRPDRVRRPAPPRLGRGPLDYPGSSSRGRPVVGASETRDWAGPHDRRGLPARLAARHQAGLLRRQGPPDAGTARRPHGHEPAGSRVPCTPPDDIVSLIATPN